MVKKIYNENNNNNKRLVKEGESYGWVVDSSEAWEAYDLACEYFGKEYMADQLASYMGLDDLSEALAYIFRQHDFTAWKNRNDDEDEDIEESVNVKRKKFAKSSKAGNWRAEDVTIEMDDGQSTWNKYIKDYDGYKIEVVPVYNQKYDQIDWTVYLYRNGKTVQKLEVFETPYDARDFADYEVYDLYIEGVPTYKNKRSRRVTESDSDILDKLGITEKELQIVKDFCDNGNANEEIGFESPKYGMVMITDIFRDEEGDPVFNTIEQAADYYGLENVRDFCKKVLRYTKRIKGESVNKFRANKY